MTAWGTSSATGSIRSGTGTAATSGSDGSRRRQPAAPENLNRCVNARSAPAGLRNFFNVAAMPHGKRQLPAVANPSGPDASRGAGANPIAVYPGQMPPPEGQGQQL